jgi:hypothetical protein
MRRAALATFLSAVSASTLAAPALAAGPGPAPPGTSPPAPAPAPTQPVPAPTPKLSPGQVKLEVLGGMSSGSRTYVVSGDIVTIVGHVTPYVARQKVRIRITSPQRRRTLIRAKIRKGNVEGRFTVRFRARRAVAYGIYVRHDRTPQQALFQARAGAQAVDGNDAGDGSRGLGVALLKQGLRGLGYPAGSGPYWTGALSRALMAYRKTNDMTRLFTANRQVFEKVFAGQGAFKLLHPEAGKHVEFDWSRQVLALADGAKVVATYHASSGKPSTPTVLGMFHFYLKSAGVNAKGMFDSNYFIAGYAVHGYPDVPTYPASHGCIRVPNADAPAIFAWIQLGDPIFVYR